MKLMKNLRWAVIAASILSGPAFAAAFTCDVTPKNSVITEGQSLQLAATCNGALTSINWLMDGVSVTGDVALAGHVAGTPVHYTTPVGLGGSNTFVFSVGGTSGTSGADTYSTTSPATVVVKPSSAVVARAAGSATPTTPVNATCGAADSTAVSAMPTNGQQCDIAKGKPALAISGPTAFTWSCVSLTGGLEANCSAVRGFTVAATTVGANGSVGPASQGVANGGTATVSALPSGGYTAAFTSGCGGTQSGNSFTTGPVTSNCTVNASFTNSPVHGACGSASNSTVVTTAPSGNLCSTGSATAVATNSTNYSWSCNGANGGTTATSCSVPRGYTITASAGINGTISPASRDVAANTTTSFTVTPDSGYAATVTGCGGSLSGTTYTTGSTTAACSVAASFAVQTVSATDPGVGTGLWIPPNTSKVLIADQSGSSSIYKTSYIPGCLNGDYITTSSSSGCGGNAFFPTSASTTFAFGSGNILGLRYTSKAGAGSSVKYFTWASGDGGNVGQTVKVWLSDSPTATYDATSSLCKLTSTTQPYVITGPGYCTITANKLYYVFTSTDAVGTNYRYLVNETSSDFD